MKKLILILQVSAVASIWAGVEAPNPKLAECRKLTDEALASELKACKSKPEAERKACTKDALDKNAVVLQTCGSVLVKPPENPQPMPPT